MMRPSSLATPARPLALSGLTLINLVALVLLPVAGYLAPYVAALLFPDQVPGYEFLVWYNAGLIVSCGISFGYIGLIFGPLLIGGVLLVLLAAWRGSNDARVLLLGIAIAVNLPAYVRFDLLWANEFRARLWIAVVLVLLSFGYFLPPINRFYQQSDAARR